MSESDTYRKLHERLIEARKTGGSDKTTISNEIRQLEREGARAGRILTAVHQKDGTVAVTVKDAPSKRSLQEEYCRKFDADAVVNVGGREQTLRKYHESRLLGKR